MFRFCKEAGGGMIKKVIETVTVLGIGGVGYGLLELIWRGYTHPSMVILGGLCLLGLYECEKRFSPLPLWLRCFSGGIFITSLELVTGCIVNTAFKMNVWDYSRKSLNLFGQICPQFSALWMLLCVPAFFICRKLFRHFHKSV